jgi:hypothetical protein
MWQDLNEQCIESHFIGRTVVSAPLIKVVEKPATTTVPSLEWRNWIQFEPPREVQPILPAVSTMRDLVDLVASINLLADGKDEDEFGRHRPSLKGLSDCLGTVLELAKEGKLRRPTDFSVDANGDLRLTWSHLDREAELVFPFETDETPYLYYSCDAEYGTSLDLSTTSIVERVRWVARGSGENA